MVFSFIARLISASLVFNVACGESVIRGRRSDDFDPLTTVVTELTQKVDQLTARLQAQENEFQARIASLEWEAGHQTVAFTAQINPNSADVEDLQPGQVLKFDRVLLNQGSAYNPATGIFTAPHNGSYVFFTRVMMNVHFDELIQTAIYKGNTYLAWADACCHTHDSGATLVTIHLNQGETTHVRVHSGSKLWGGHTSFSGFKLA